MSLAKFMCFRFYTCCCPFQTLVTAFFATALFHAWHWNVWYIQEYIYFFLISQLKMKLLELYNLMFWFWWPEIFCLQNSSFPLLYITCSDILHWHQLVLNLKILGNILNKVMDLYFRRENWPYQWHCQQWQEGLWHVNQQWTGSGLP